MYYTIRPLTPTDESFLWEMLYQAIYVPEGSAPPSREITTQPEISRYIEGWGRPDDNGYIAMIDETQQPIGAAWIRLMTGDNKGYGFIDNETPELSMAVLPEYRGQGIGTNLLKHILENYQVVYRFISLSVSIDNPALRLYTKMSFEVVEKNGPSLTMRRMLSKS